MKTVLTEFQRLMSSVVILDLAMYEDGFMILPPGSNGKECSLEFQEDPTNTARVSIRLIEVILNSGKTESKIERLLKDLNEANHYVSELKLSEIIVVLSKDDCDKFKTLVTFLQNSIPKLRQLVLDRETGELTWVREGATTTFTATFYNGYQFLSLHRHTSEGVRQWFDQETLEWGFTPTLIEEDEYFFEYLFTSLMNS